MLFSERCFGEREKAIMKISEKTQKGVIEDDKRMTSLHRTYHKDKSIVYKPSQQFSEHEKKNIARISFPSLCILLSGRIPLEFDKHFFISQ